MKRAAILFTGLILSSAAGLLPVTAATNRPAVVVELFTSQGCSSCPPANANLIKLVAQPEILALSYSVTYWDYLGWKDSFGRQEYTDRQVIYEPALGQSGPYTPQMVFNGQTTAVGNNFGEVEQFVARSIPLDGPAITLSATTADVAAGSAPSAIADVWLVHYEDDIIEVPIGRGENTGRTLPHTNVVHALQHLGTWTGAASSYPLTAAPEGLRTAILVQLPTGGPILVAATD